MINEIFSKLTEDERNQLIYSFNNSIDCIVDLGDSKILGVNITDLKDIEIIYRKGDWIFGRRKDLNENNRYNR